LGIDLPKHGTFVGLFAGANNTAGESNAFFGAFAGAANNTGNFNTFIGAQAGYNNTNGGDNSFFGYNAGASNAGGINNSFFGLGAGQSNVAGGGNSFFGVNAGENSTGGYNSFFGLSAGDTNTTGFANTIIGEYANVGSNNLTHATAIGSRARVDQSNSLVLGSINGINGALDDTNVGIGTTAPAARLDIKSSGPTNIALQISMGGIKVAGAGVGTSTPVFIHRVTAGNITTCLHCTRIDHPLTNGDPNAILIVTPNFNPGGIGGIRNAHPISVYYEPALSRWLIFNQDFSAMPIDAAFNVLIVKP
jgi:hypothetical protein